MYHSFTRCLVINEKLLHIKQQQIEAPHDTLLDKMLIQILIAIFSGILAFSLWKLNQNYSLASLTRKITTIDGTPVESKAAVVGGFWGSNFDFLSMNLGKSWEEVGWVIAECFVFCIVWNELTPLVFAEEFFDYSRIFAENLKRNYIQYFILTPVYNIIDAETAELVLNDSRLLSKGVVYEFLHPFLKTGLLTSTGKFGIWWIDKFYSRPQCL